MRFVKPLGKAAKFTAVTMPLSIFGWQLNKRLFAWVRALCAGSINPTCPDCDSGILLAQTDASAILDQPVKATDKPQPLYPWACNHCGFTLLAGLDHKHVGEVARRHRFGRARAAFGDLAMQERDGFAGKHRVASRIFFGTSAAMLVGGIYMLASGTSLMIALPWLSFSGMYWIFGMTRSYRAWQVATGHLFVEGAARHWFSHEKWFV